MLPAALLRPDLDDAGASRGGLPAGASGRWAVVLPPWVWDKLVL